MIAAYRPTGILVALATPLMADRRTVDAAAFRQLLDYVIEGGVSGVVVLGGTGEYTALSLRERERAIATVVERVAHRVPVIAGILSPGIGDAIHMAGLAKGCGANAVMMVTPYYVHFNADGIVEYFRSVAEIVDLPLILYNIPYRTGVNLTPEAVFRLAEACPSIVGIKECSSDLGQVSQLIASLSDRLSVLCGEEYLTLPELVLGAGGAVLASANLVPKEWVRIYEHVRAGRAGEARTMYFRLLPLLRLLFAETNPGPLKEALTLLGIASGPVAPPLQRPVIGIREQLATVLDDMGLSVK